MSRGDVEWVYPVYTYSITAVEIVHGAEVSRRTTAETFVFKQAAAWTDDERNQERRLALVVEQVRKRYPIDGRVVGIQPTETRFVCWVLTTPRLNNDNIAPYHQTGGPR